MMNEKEERQEKRERKYSTSSSSSVSSSTSSYSSDSDDGNHKTKRKSKYEDVKRKEEKRSSPEKKEDVKSHYIHRSRHKDKDRKSEHSRSRRDWKRERSYRRSRSPIHRPSSHRHSRREYERIRRRSRSRSRSFDRNMSRKSYNKSLKKLNMLEKLGIELKVPEGQPAVAQTTQLPDGITIPSYYNPAGVNPLKYAQQMQKRKLLWGNSQKPTTTQTTAEKTEEQAPVGPETVWKGTSFSNDQDGKLTAKFKRLMGIKSSETEKNSESSGPSLIKKQEEIFESMEKQYEVARVATHTHRGLGLGFGLHQPR